MKRLLLSLLILHFSFSAVEVQAQKQHATEHRTGARITRSYNNVSLSDALNGLNKVQRDYSINFLYNELEDFRITTTINRSTVIDAIRQMIGFYPVRMTVQVTCLIFVRIFVLPVRCNQSLKRIGRDLPDLYFSIPVFIIRIFLSVHY